MKLSDIAKRMVLVIVICTFAILAACAVLAFLHITEFVPAALGAMLGAAISISKVVMIDSTVKKIAGMESERAGSYVRMQHFLRFGLTAILLAIAAIAPFIDLISATAGVLSFQAATLSMRRTAGKGAG